MPRTIEELTQFKQTLIKRATKSELKLLSQLREAGFNPEFQYIIEPFIVDFCFVKQKKIIELDGEKFHNKIKDVSRDLYLHNKGFIVLRIPSHLVFKQPHKTLKKIEEFIYSKSK